MLLVSCHAADVGTESDAVLDRQGVATRRNTAARMPRLFHDGALDRYASRAQGDPAGIVLAVLVTTLLVTTPAVARAQTYFPSAPDPPRLQLLKTLRSEADIRKNPNWFMRFLFGRQLQDQWLRKSLKRPYSVAFRGSDLLVSDTQSDSYWIFDLEERTLDVAADMPGQGGIGSSLGLATDGTGRILVTDSTRKELLVLAGEGQIIGRYGRGVLERPAGVAVEGDSAFVADTAGNRVVAFNLTDGGHRIVVGGEDKYLSPLGGPTNLTIAPDGSLYISETLAGRVSRYARNGTHIATLGELGIRFGDFGAPKGLAFDRQGRLYVADARFEHIQVFDAEGNVLIVFGRTGMPESDLSLPAGIAIDYDSVPFWQQYAADGFTLEYIIAVTTQFEPASVYIYGFGRMAGVDYGDDPPPR